MPRTRIGHNWNVHIGFRSDQTMKNNLEDMAAHEGVTCAVLLRDMVNTEIKRRNQPKYRDRLFKDFDDRVRRR